ncbi:uncharacterized protein LOC111255342 isoform X3 [Varroa destructor]|uniref:Otopetrin n=1 Tax=Varroa destructor TaxID=109461 RepID=A0A7M7KW81_VARDE|nr:uncharacterized protein LOC111255342 isoform X3 [Varroa destructor]
MYQMVPSLTGLDMFRSCVPHQNDSGPAWLKLLRKRKINSEDGSMIKSSSYAGSPHCDCVEVCYGDPDGQDLSDDVKTAELAASDGGRDPETNSFGTNLAVPRHSEVIGEKAYHPVKRAWSVNWSVDVKDNESRLPTPEPPGVQQGTLPALGHATPGGGHGNIGGGHGSVAGHGEGNLDDGYHHRTAKKYLSSMLSTIYCVFLVCMGSTFCATESVLEKRHEHGERNHSVKIFSILVSLIGIGWLFALHIDILWYKNSASRQVRSRTRPSQGNLYMHSTASVFKQQAKRNLQPQLWFLEGRHSGSFYLKGGMVVFCFCHLINEGLQLEQYIQLVCTDGAHTNNVLGVVFHVLRPIYAFYQLFMAFKYSNIVINHSRHIARFGAMHLIATSLYFWFFSIVEEYKHAEHDSSEMSRGHLLSHHGNDSLVVSLVTAVSEAIHGSNSLSNHTSYTPTHHAVSQREERAVHSGHDTRHDTGGNSGHHGKDHHGSNITGFLQPFTVEYNIILAGVWFIVWQNIGRGPEIQIRRESICTTGQDARYQSNLVVSADCHASNKGLFAGLFLLLVSVVALVIAQEAQRSNEGSPQVVLVQERFRRAELMIFLVQDNILVIVALLAVCWAYWQIRTLDFSVHPITLLDDVLLYVPLPFFFLYFFMSMIADVYSQKLSRVSSNVITVIQVVLQTLFLSDGLRRCSNQRRHQFLKPGRELVTFLIICNITMWVTTTFKTDTQHESESAELIFGKSCWILIKHATLPLMLFYRFHSSVCLSDIWKSAYETGE